MSQLFSRYILPIKPNEYLVQGLSHCGAYSVKGILSAYDRDSKNHPKEYHTNWLSKVTGSGFTKQYYVTILKNYGISATGKNATGLGNDQKTDLLKKLLSQNNIVMLSISNGYNDNGDYSSVRALFSGHWITLWGFDDKEQIFYLYDSCIPLIKHDKNIPIGNTKRTYQEILRDWRGSLNTQLLGFGQYYYIQASK